MPTIRTLTAEVVGDTLNLNEEELSLATTPLAEVPTDTALDSIIGVKDGVPKQVASLDAGMVGMNGTTLEQFMTLATSPSITVTIGTANFTTTATKRAGIVTLAFTVGATSGTPFSSFSSGTVIGTIPEGYRPTRSLYLPAYMRNTGAWAVAEYIPVFLNIATDGTMTIWGNTANMQTMQFFFCTCLFPAAN